MVSGEFGFLYPEIDKELCINCGICEDVCQIGKEVSVPTDQVAYAAVNKDKNVLLNSTSGGAFSSLAMAVLNDGGVVYGACMEDLKVRHIRVESPNELCKLRGSKYLQSRIENAFVMAEQDLKDGRGVLFSGTPCQIAGLKHFLGKDYEKLITVDIICHGVGSQGYFDKFSETLNSKRSKLKEIKFRSKKFSGWSCASGAFVVRNEDGSETERPFYCHENYYYHYFLSGDIHRKSCYECKYANLNRPGDITLGDFWGIEALKLSINTYNGCSLLIVNSARGRKLLDKLLDLDMLEVSVDDAKKNNTQLIHPSEYSASRDERLREYETKTGLEIDKIYRRICKKSILKGKIKRIIPYSVKLLLRKWI